MNAKGHGKYQQKKQEATYSWNIFQKALKAVGVDNMVPVEKQVKGKFQDNLSFQGFFLGALGAAKALDIAKPSTTNWRQISLP